MATTAEPLVRSVALSPHLSEVTHARRLIAEVACGAGFTEDRVFDIAVACSEAIANAIEHSPIKAEVWVRTVLRPDRLEVEVRGPGEFQAPNRLGAKETRGLGLPLMAKLSDHLALFSGPTGETFVSLTFYRPGAHVTHGGAVAPTFANLAEENRLLDDVLSNFPDRFYVLDQDWRFVYLNPPVASATDRTREELLGRVIWDAYPDHDREARRVLEEVRETGSPATVTAHAPSSGWREWTVFPVEEGLAVISRDITKRKQAEAVSESLRFMLSEAQAIAHVGSFEYVAETGATVWSDEQCRIYGIPPGSPSPSYDEMLRRFYHPDDAALLHETFTAALRTGSVYELEHRIIRPDGSVRFIHDRAHPYFDEQGKLLRYVGATVDITERRLAEEALRESEARFRSVLDSSLDGIYRVNLQTGRYAYMSPAFGPTIGRSNEEFRDLSPEEAMHLVHPDDLPRVIDALRAG